MTIADGFFFGVGFMGSVLVLVLFVLVVTLITAFIGYVSSKRSPFGKTDERTQSPRRNTDRNDR